MPSDIDNRIDQAVAPAAVAPPALPSSGLEALQALRLERDQWKRESVRWFCVYCELTHRTFEDAVNAPYTANDDEVEILAPKLYAAIAATKASRERALCFEKLRQKMRKLKSP